MVVHKTSASLVVEGEKWIMNEAGDSRITKAVLQYILGLQKLNDNWQSKVACATEVLSIACSEDCYSLEAKLEVLEPKAVELTEKNFDSYRLNPNTWIQWHFKLHLQNRPGWVQS